MSEIEVRKAKDYLRAHAGYTENEERVRRMIREAGVIDIDGVFKKLLACGDIIEEFPGGFWPYTLKFIAVKGKEEG